MCVIIMYYDILRYMINYGILHIVIISAIRCMFNGVRTFNRGTVNHRTVKRGQLIAAQLITWTHKRADT